MPALAIILAALLGLSSVSYAADDIRMRDTAHEEDVMNAFRHLCLDMHGKPDSAADAAVARGGVVLPAEYAKGLLGRKEGRSWKVDGPHGLYVLSLLKDGTCQIYGYRTDPLKMLELFERDLIKTNQREDILLHEVRLHYTISYKRPGMAAPEEMRVMLQRSTHSRADSVILSTQLAK